VLELDPVESRKPCTIPMVADNERNAAMKFAFTLPVQEIRQTVKVLRDENGHPRDFRHLVEPPLHLQFRGQLLKIPPERLQVEFLERPFDSHKEQAGLVVLMLIGVRNIRTVPVEKTGHSGDQALAIRTINAEDGGIPHCLALA
jgi:hypothetical protein